MKKIVRGLALLMALTLAALSFAQESVTRRDQKALEVLRNMDGFKAGLEAWSIRGSDSRDSRLPHGLIISNTSEVTVSFRQPGSFHFQGFDGASTRQLFVHDGLLTLYDSDKNVYSQVEVPRDIDSALDYALEEFAIDLPLMDLVKQDTFDQLVESSDSVHYLTDKARVQGVDCHHIAVRTPDVDLQIWVQEGDQPLPRRIMITDKWAGGAPRFTGNMSWDIAPRLEDREFAFEPPEDASRVELMQAEWR